MKGGGTDCQNVSESWSCKHSGPKPNLNEETDHLARWPMSGHGSTGGLLTVVCVFLWFFFMCQHTSDDIFVKKRCSFRF
jgi:hypothetical protein